MKLNADLNEPAVARFADGEWVPSPLPGVERRMLDRDGDEVARATSFVRYAPGSSFSAHTHSGGEEYLVLEGTFSDESGDYPQGSYVHNPVGSEHTPRSDDGCVIFVKLHWMRPEDQETVRITPPLSEGWQRADGVERLPLHGFDGERSELVRLEGGAGFDWAPHGGGEVLVLEGDVNVRFSDREERLATNDWLRLPVGRRASFATAEGCRLFCKQGHLHSPPPLPSA